MIVAAPPPAPSSSAPTDTGPDRYRSFLFGADYYPEHWPESYWEDDARRMRDAGVTAVRMAEFAWYLMEPRRAPTTSASSIGRSQ